MSSPTVSIAIRAYRREWLGEAIASVLGQTHRDLELVVYDDAGDLQDVALSFGDERLRYHRAPEHLDAAGRYKAAAGLCRGRYVGLLDDDDRYEPGFVAELLKALEADPRAAAAVSRFRWDYEGRLVTPPDSRPPGLQADAASAFADLRWPVTPSTTLFRREALADGERRHPMPDGVSPDRFVNVRAAAAGWHFLLVDAPLVAKRWHDGQVSHDRSLTAHDVAVSTWQQLPVDNAELDMLRRRHLARSHTRRAARRVLGGDANGARADLRCARAVDPRSWRWRRRLLTALAVSPPVARAALRLRGLLPHIRRRLREPPAAGTGVGRGALAVAAGGAGAQALLLLTAPILTRFYTPAELGAAAVITGVAAIASVLVCLRLDAAIPLARDRRSLAELTTLCLVTGSVVTLALTVATATLGGRLARAAHIEALAVWLWLVPLQAAIASVGLVATGLLVRTERYRTLGRVRWAQAAAGSATKIAGGAAGAGSPALALGTLAGAATNMATAIAGLRHSERPPLISRHFLAAARRFGRFAAWSSTGVVFSTAGWAVIPIIVAVLYGPAAAGLFVLAQRLLQTPVQVAGDALQTAWFGTAARLVRTDGTKLRAPLLRLTARLALAGGAALTLAVVLGPPLLGPLFGESWRHAGDLLPALAVVQLALFLSIPAGQTLQALERTDLQAGISAARLTWGLGALFAAHALGWSLAAGLGLYAGGSAVVSAVAVATAARVAGRAAGEPGAQSSRSRARIAVGTTEEAASTNW